MNPLVYFLPFTNNFQTKTLSVSRHKNSLLPFLMQNREQAERRVLETNKYPQSTLDSSSLQSPVYSLYSAILCKLHPSYDLSCSLTVVIPDLGIFIVLRNPHTENEQS